MASVQKITANLWFDTQAEEAANYYCSIFKNAKVNRVTHFGKEGYDIHKMPEGAVMTMEFELEGTRFIALNGGPIFKFNEAVSFVVSCKDQREIDYYWDKLSDGGDETAQQCGWLKDKFGLSWQVIPKALDDMMADEDHGRKERVMKVMLQMKKMDLKKLEQAYLGSAQPA